MQSSGASLFALFAGQAPGTLTVVDLWSPEVAPPLRTSGSVVLKATVGNVPLTAHRRSFRPCKTVLFVRHPVDVAASVATKSYAEYGGTIAEKLTAMDHAFARSADFDLTVFYEQFATCPVAAAAALRELGLELPDGAERFPRLPAAIVDHAVASSEWCAHHYRRRWGLGNVHADALDRLAPIQVTRTATAWALARRHAPGMLAHYESGMGVCP